MIFLEYKKKILSGISWNVLSFLISAPLAYFVRVYYSHELPKLDVGLYYAVWDLFCVFAIFKALGLEQAIIKYIPKYIAKNEYNMVKSSIVITGILQFLISGVFSGILILLAPLIAKYYINNQGQFSNDIFTVINVLILMTVGLQLLQGCADFFSNIISGFQKQNYASSTRVVKIASVLIFSFIFINFFNLKNAYAPALAYAITPIIMIIIYSSITFKKIYPNFFKDEFIFSKKIVKDLFSYSIPVMIGSAGSIILGYLDGICLTYFTGLNTVADYRNVALPTVTILSYISVSVASVLFPMSSELWEKGHKEILNSIFEKISYYSFLLILPFSLLMAYLPETIIGILFTPEYLSASEPMKILSIGAIFLTLNTIGFSVLNGIGKPALSTKILYIGAFFNLTFNLLLIPKFGVFGAAITTVIGYLIMWILQIIYLRKFLHYSLNFNKYVLVSIVGIFSLIPLFLMKNIVFSSLIMKLSSFTITYFLMYLTGLFMFKLISINELKNLLNVK